MRSKESAMFNRRYYLQFSIYFLVFGSAIALITSLVNYNIQYSDIERQVAGKFSGEKLFKLTLLENFIRNAEDTTNALISNPITLSFALAPTEINRELLNNLLLSTSTANDAFIQVRYLDKTGMERVRVDRPHGDAHPFVVPANNLQDKSDRYYFQETAHLPKGRFWHSKLDLNVEHGVIETPIRPTFRVAAPVFADNNMAGIIIINLKADQLIWSLRASTELLTYIVDRDGEFIVHYNPENSWSRYLPDRSGLLIQFPKIGPEILAKRDVDNKLFVSFSLDSQFQNDDDARMILLPKQEMLDKLSHNNLITDGVIAMIVLLTSIPLSWLAALVPSRLQTSLNSTFLELKKYANLIDRRVITCTTTPD